MEVVTQRETSVECPFCATGIPADRRAMLQHTLHCHKVGMVAWALIAGGRLAIFWAILAGPNPPPTLP